MIILLWLTIAGLVILVGSYFGSYAWERWSPESRRTERLQRDIAKAKREIRQISYEAQQAMIREACSHQLDPRARRAP